MLAYSSVDIGQILVVGDAWVWPYVWWTCIMAKWTNPREAKKKWVYVFPLFAFVPFESSNVKDFVRWAKEEAFFFL